MRRFLESQEAVYVTESEAEAKALRLMLRHHLEPTDAGVDVGGYRVDFLFAPERVVVEVDGYRYHRTKGRFIGDRRRMASLLALGYVVFPLTWADLGANGREAMRRLRHVLERRRAEFLRSPTA